MIYDVNRIASLCDRIYSTTKARSPERTAALEKLSEADREAMYDYDMGVLSGRIKKVEVKEEMATGQKSYEWYVSKMNSDQSGTMQEVSQFAMQCPELYQQYRERHQQELRQEQALKNRRLGENKHKNKPYSMQ